MSDINNFKEKLEDWKHRLGDRDMHSIGKQIADMLWRSAFYRSVNESRLFLPEEKDGLKQANGSLHELIDYGYFVANSTAIRRLLDRGATTGNLGVYSLFGLLRDIKNHAKLITRANILEARGLNYEFEPIKQRAFEEATAKGGRSFFISGRGWQHAEYWHHVMDQLCGVKAENRHTNDTPDQNKLELLLEELTKHGRNVQVWVDKFVAHAASPESRKTLCAEHQSLNLANMWLAERVVVRTANFISHNFVDGTNIGGVPIPQFDQFLYLDRPFIQPSALPAMYHAWDRHCKEIGYCENWSWDSPLADESDVWKMETSEGGHKGGGHKGQRGHKPI